MPIVKTKPKTELSQLNIEIVGPPKIGKTHMANALPNPVFICTEPGQGGLELPHWAPKDWSGKVYIIKGVDDLDQCIAELTQDMPPDRTIIIDTIDNLIATISRSIAVKYKVDGLNWGNLGYGKGRDLLNQKLREILTSLSVTPAGLWLLSHLQESEISSGDSTQLNWKDSLDNKSKMIIQSFVDAIWFMKKEGKKRILQTSGDISLEAGSRLSLPERIPMGESGEEAYANLYKAFYENRPKPEENARIALLERIRKGEKHLADNKIDRFDTEVRKIESRKTHLNKITLLEKAETADLEKYLEHLLSKITPKENTDATNS